MGWEVANIHIGSRSPQDLAERLARLEREAGKGWLVEAAEAMMDCTRTDYKQWKKHVKRQG